KPLGYDARQLRPFLRTERPLLEDRGEGARADRRWTASDGLPLGRSRRQGYKRRVVAVVSVSGDRERPSWKRRTRHATPRAWFDATRRVARPLGTFVAPRDASRLPKTRCSGSIASSFTQGVRCEAFEETA